MASQNKVFMFKMNDRLLLQLPVGFTALLLEM